MYFISNYNLDWPVRFEQIASYLKTYLPDNCKIHHVGSTSVPGMPAKDIIDIDIEYVAGTKEIIFRNLENAGYKHLGDLGIHGRDAFKVNCDTLAAKLPDHHLYACESGAYELIKHLAYRDYLRSNKDRALWLGNKKLLAANSSKSKDEYIEKKSCYYELITRESMDWLARRGTGM
jgi:GrpB-like predicted nucleotidyltransferase (UPF0157 family)